MNTITVKSEYYFVRSVSGLDRTDHSGQHCVIYKKGQLVYLDIFKDGSVNKEIGSDLIKRISF